MSVSGCALESFAPPRMTAGLFMVGRTRVGFHGVHRLGMTGSVGLKCWNICLFSSRTPGCGRGPRADGGGGRHGGQRRPAAAKGTIRELGEMAMPRKTLSV